MKKKQYKKIIKIGDANLNGLYAENVMLRSKLAESAHTNAVYAKNENKVFSLQEENKSLKDTIENGQARKFVQHHSGGRNWGKTEESTNWLQTSVYKAEHDKLVEANTRLKLQNEELQRNNMAGQEKLDNLRIINEQLEARNSWQANEIARQFNKIRELEAKEAPTLSRHTGNDEDNGIKTKNKFIDDNSYPGQL